MAMAWAIGIGLFLFLLLVFPRRTMGLTALCGVALGGFLLWTKMKNDERDRKRATIVVTVVHDLEQCSPEVPLFVQISNHSDDTVEKVSFAFKGYRSGYSKPVYDSGYSGYSSDRIIKGGDDWGSCWPLPRKAHGTSQQGIASTPPETLVWTVTNISPIFRKK